MRNKIVYANIIIKKIKHFKFLYVSDTIFTIIGAILQLVVLSVYINPTINSLIWEQLLVYVFLSSYIGHVVSLFRVPEFAEKIINGNYAVYALRPVSYCTQFFFIEVGESLRGAITGVILFAISLSIIILRYQSFRILEFLLTFILSIILSTMLSITFFSLTVVTKKEQAPKAIFQCISSLLSGSLLPLILWPENLVKYLKFTPFALIINAPIEVGLGTQTFQTVFLFQLFWLFIFGLGIQFIVEKILSHQEHIGG